MRRQRYLRGVGASTTALLSTVTAGQATRSNRARPGSIAVSLRRVGDPVRAGDVLAVGVGLENEGDTPSSRELRLRADGEVVDARSITVPGNTRWPVPISLSYRTAPSAGDSSVPIVVESGDDEDCRLAEVVATADGTFAVEFFTVENPVDAGDRRTVRVRVENTGTVTQTQAVTLFADAEEVASASVTVPENEARSFALSYETRPTDRAVSVPLVVETEDDAARRVVERRPGSVSGS